ncbi:MAG: hypothetical protein Q4C60_07385 [Eubacteriales bacterium]|nr:hypothetical protein [Eubacteriales bacterium]
MRNYKKDRNQFLVWMRNGIAFCTTWFLILVLAYNYICGNQMISTVRLIKMVFLVIGGVFLFNLFFTHLLIRKFSFIKRLTGFMIAISVYESFGFWWLDIFGTDGTKMRWSVFVVIILALYLICIVIYQNYSKRQGEIYTQALQKYQEKRNREHEK